MILSDIKMFICTFCERISWYSLHSSLDTHWANLEIFFPHEALLYCHVCMQSVELGWILILFLTCDLINQAVPSCDFWWQIFWIHNLTHTQSHPCLLRVLPVSNLLIYPYPTSSNMGIVKLWIFLSCGIWHLYFILSFLGPNIFLGYRHSIQFMSWLVHDGSHFRLIWHRVTL